MRKGGSVKLVHLTKKIYDVLQITPLSSVFEIFDDTQKALASFGGAPEGDPSPGTVAWKKDSVKGVLGLSGADLAAARRISDGERAGRLV